MLFHTRRSKRSLRSIFVAVPAQPRAGTTKNYGGKKIEEKNKNNEEAEIDLKIKNLASFLFTEKENLEV